ncbi:MAG: hypothetical protein PHS26_09880, partial [Actinomycetota bacterium]|nr:hypothetical protein [Actinomycetota bacterium]
LPTIVPTPEESYRLANVLRRKMAQPLAPSRVYSRGQLAAAAFSALVLATVTGVSLAVWSGGSPVTVTEETSSDEVAVGELTEPGSEPGTESAAGETVETGGALAALARPSLVASGAEYASADLDDFRNDLGTRLDFYSTYWYSDPTTVSQPATLKRLQADLTADLAAQAAAGGHDPAELERAVTTVMEQAGSTPVLPCYVERAKVEGKEVWLISASSPEDYLLFPDPQQPPAMVLASLGGIEGLKVSESLLREMAARLAPYKNGGAALQPDNTKDRDEAYESGGTAEEVPVAENEAEGTAGDADATAVEEDFQSFLRRLAAQGTSLELISALRGLNYEQIVMLLQGNWSALAADGVNLSDFLTPPQRLWAVECASGAVVWSAK